MPKEPDHRQHPAYKLIMKLAEEAQNAGWPPPARPTPLISMLSDTPCIPSVDDLTGAARSKIAMAAKLICGKLPEPDWLRPTLERIVAAELMLHLANIPDATHLEVAADILSATKAAETLHNLFARRSAAIPIIAKAAGDERPATMDFMVTLWRTLDKEFLPRAKLAVSEVQKPTASPPDTLRAKRCGRKKCVDVRRLATQICGVVTNEAWRVVHGKYPPESSDAACEAADALFSAAGWQPSTYRQMPASPGRWRRDLASTRPSKSDDDFDIWLRAGLRKHFVRQISR